MKDHWWDGSLQVPQLPLPILIHANVAQSLSSEAVRVGLTLVSTMKNGVFLVVRPFGCCKNRRFVGT
jgi:hypothetical protein